MPLPETPLAPEMLVSQWIESFNDRNLEGLLACMNADVRFYPLRLSGFDRFYHGHDGVCSWFRRMEQLGYAHRIALHNVRAGPDGEVVAIGELRLDEGSDAARFWARDQVVDGQIVVSHHYLTDPDIFDDIGSLRKRRGRPLRFHGM
jgi:SnoaL-like domain